MIIDCLFTNSLYEGKLRVGCLKGIAICKHNADGNYYSTY